MSPRIKSFLTYIGAAGIIAIAAFVLTGANATPPSADGVQTASIGSVQMPAPSSDATEKQGNAGTSSSPSTETEVIATRIGDPYPFPALSFSSTQARTRAALVNILCTSSNGTISPTTGSGVIIDPRGIVLTNAHVAQYVLLAQSGKTNLSCVARTGSPAEGSAQLALLYIPPVWVFEHAHEITLARPSGTGEHDYALLLMQGSGALPSLPVDTREAIGFLGDTVVAAAYPAEFIGATGALFSLYPIASVSPIRELLTFETSTVDMISLEAVLEAQGGSSGGPVVNAWGHLVGIITTSSAEATTAERELRALTTNYIDRDVRIQSGRSLGDILQGDLVAQAMAFQSSIAPNLAQRILDHISSPR